MTLGMSWYQGFPSPATGTGDDVLSRFEYDITTPLMGGKQADCCKVISRRKPKAFPVIRYRQSSNKTCTRNVRNKRFKIEF